MLKPFRGKKVNHLKNLAINMIPDEELKTLQKFRDCIDVVDERLIQLFDERASLVFKVGEWKKKHSYEIHDPNREKQILDKIIKSKRVDLKDAEIQTLFMKMIDFYRHTEKARTLINSARESKIISSRGSFGFLGFGLMGASIALALREQFPQWKFLIYDPYLAITEFESWNKANAKSTFQIVNIHQLEDLDFLFLAAPIDINNKFGAQLALKNKLTLNLGSYQDHINNVIGFHPLAGKEVTGYQSAQSDLFYGKTICITHPELISSEALASIECLANSLGAESLATKSDIHNESLAYTSHLLQLLSMSLGLTLEKTHLHHLSQLIPSAAKELLRLNGSDFKMWDPVFRKNQKNLIKALNDFEGNLNDVKSLIATLNTDEDLSQVPSINNPIKKNKSNIKSLRDLFSKAHQIYESIYLKRKAK